MWAGAGGHTQHITCNTHACYVVVCSVLHVVCVACNVCCVCCM